MLVEKFRCYELNCIDGQTTLADIFVGDFPNSFSIEYFGESFDTLEEAKKALDKFIQDHLTIAYKSFTILPVYVHLLKK